MGAERLMQGTSIPMLFSEASRTDHSPARHTESRYAFLDRSAWPACAAIRRELQKWFDEYPAKHRHALTRRLVAGDFDAAFFELFLHEMLRQTGHRPEVDPLVDSGLHPDFAANGPFKFTLEAAVVSEKSDVDRTQEALHSVLCDEINKLESPDYFLCIAECELKGSDQPSGRAIRDFLAERIAAENYDQVADTHAAGFDTPVWQYEDGRVRLVVRPIPKVAARGEPGVRSIGIYPVRTRWGGSDQAMRKRLAEKANRYKNLKGPFVIAVNCIGEWVFSLNDVTEDLTTALFGSEQIVVDAQTRDARPARARDGLLYGQRGPRNTRISAVLATTVLPWTVAKASVQLILNPWAAHPLADTVLPVDVAKVVDGQLRIEPGPPLREVFDLPYDWPGERRG